MTRSDPNILVLEEDIILGQLLCDMIRMYRIGVPQLSMSEVDACQMMEAQDYDICLLGVHLRGRACNAAVDTANARNMPVLLLANGSGSKGLTSRPDHGLVVQKPASEEELRHAISVLLGDGAAG